MANLAGLVSLLFMPYNMTLTVFREVKMIQKRLKQLQAENNRRDAKMYANMFSRLTKDTDVPTKVCIHSF